MLTVRRAFAFLKRDVAIDLSYRLRLPAQFASVLITTVLFFFVGKLVGPGQAGVMEQYGGDYFAFVLIGVAFTDYLFVAVNSFGDEIRKGQMLGTLEAMLVTPLSSTGILVYSSLYQFVFTTLRVVVYLATGVLFFGVQLHVSHVATLLFVLVLTILSFWGIGLLSAAFVIVFKQKSPISWAVGALSGLFGGVMFPVEILPAWLKPVSALLPITYSLEAMRMVLLDGAGMSGIYNQILILFVFTVVLMGGGLAMFHRGMKIARKQGSLLYY